MEVGQCGPWRGRGATQLCIRRARLEGRRDHACRHSGKDDLLSTFPADRAMTEDARGDARAAARTSGRYVAFGFVELI